MSTTPSSLWNTSDADSGDGPDMAWKQVLEMLLCSQGDGPGATPSQWSEAFQNLTAALPVPSPQLETQLTRATLLFSGSGPSWSYLTREVLMSDVAFSLLCNAACTKTYEYAKLYREPFLSATLLSFPRVFTKDDLTRSPLDVLAPLSHLNTDDCVQVLTWLTWKTTCAKPISMDPEFKGVVELLTARAKVLVGSDVPADYVSQAYLFTPPVAVVSGLDGYGSDQEHVPPPPQPKPDDDDDTDDEPETKLVRTNTLFMLEVNTLCSALWTAAHVDFPSHPCSRRELELVEAWRHKLLTMVLSFPLTTLEEQFSVFCAKRRCTPFDVRLFKLRYPMLMGHADNAVIVLENKKGDCASPCKEDAGAEQVPPHTALATHFMRTKTRWFSDFLLDMASFTVNETKLTEFIEASSS